MKDIIISIFKDVKDAKNPFNKPVHVFLNRIKNGSSATENIKKYRETGDTKYKYLLPAATFQGTFSHRKADGLETFAGFAVLDFDKFKTVDDVNAIKEKLSKEPCMFSVFISPSGKGVKAVVKISDDPKNYKAYYRALCTKYKDVHLDGATSDISRLCFESYDPDIYINNDCKTWTKIENADIQDVGLQKIECTVPLQSENQIIQKLQIWFDKKYTFSKGSRNNNIFIFAAALNTFGIPKPTAEQHLAKYAQQDFTVAEINTTISSVYRSQSFDFGSKVFEDNETKGLIYKQVIQGKNYDEIKAALQEEKNPIINNEVEFKKICETIKTDDDVSVFWKYSKTGKIKLVPHKFNKYLAENNFLKYYPVENSETFIFVKKNKNLLDEISNNQIKDFVMNDLRTRENIGFAPFDYMADNLKYFENKFLNMISSTKIKIKQDEEDKCFLYFKNCVIEVTQKGIKEIDYLDLDGFVWAKQVINRDYKKANGNDSVFKDFIHKIADQDVDKTNSFKSTLGYLLHSFKGNGDNKAIILNDKKISESPNGRSGKGLFCQAVRQIKNLVLIDGKAFNFNDRFKFQGVTTDCQVLLFDDIKRNFAFENLFSVITEGINLEYKGQDSIFIPVEKSPKTIITTNYTIKGDGGSHDARKYELELSDFFTPQKRPDQYYGQFFWKKWSKQEWADFDNYMVDCLQLYLEHGLLEMNHENLAARKFINDTSFEFYEYTQENEIFPLNTRLYKTEQYESFIDEYQVDRKYFTPRKFSKSIEKYAQYYKLEIFESRDVKRYFELSDKNAINEEINEEKIPF